MHKVMNWSLVAQRTICSATQFAGDKHAHQLITVPGWAKAAFGTLQLADCMQASTMTECACRMGSNIPNSCAPGFGTSCFRLAMRRRTHLCSRGPQMGPGLLRLETAGHQSSALGMFDLLMSIESKGQRPVDGI